MSGIGNAFGFMRGGGATPITASYFIVGGGGVGGRGDGRGAGGGGGGGIVCGTVTLCLGAASWNLHSEATQRGGSIFVPGGFQKPRVRTGRAVLGL